MGTRSMASTRSVQFWLKMAVRDEQEGEVFKRGYCVKLEWEGRSRYGCSRDAEKLSAVPALHKTDGKGRRAKNSMNLPAKQGSRDMHFSQNTKAEPISSALASTSKKSLPLALTASSLLQLLLVLAASARAGPLSRSSLARCALYLLAFFLVRNALRICHECIGSLISLESGSKISQACWTRFAGFRFVPAGQTSQPASSRRAVEIVL